MEIKTIKKEPEKLTFLLKGVDPVIANTLRRVIINEVPVLAIDTVNFSVNDSVLYDEIIAHRLGLIPLKTDLKSYNLPEECKCNKKGCALCHLTLKLNVKSSAEDIMVMSDELVFSDKKIKSAYNMPIVKLIKNQKLTFDAIAVLGKGKEHAKFSPGLVFYRYYPEIKITKSNLTKIEEIAKSCPKKVYEVEGKNLIIKDLEACDLCQACAEISEAITIKGSDSDFIFVIESFGQLKPKEMLVEAVKILDKKLDNFEKELKNLGKKKKVKKTEKKAEKKKTVKKSTKEKKKEE